MILFLAEYFAREFGTSCDRFISRNPPSFTIAVYPIELVTEEGTHCIQRRALLRRCRSRSQARSQHRDAAENT